MEVVASLQRVGADVVASFQFPVKVSAPAAVGGGAVWDMPRVSERPAMTAQEIARVMLPLFEMGVFDA